MSIKKIQSELGLVGDASPNLQLVDDILKSLMHDTWKNFKNDSVLFIAQVHGGEKIIKRDGVVIGGMFNGAASNLIHAIVKAAEAEATLGVIIVAAAKIIEQRNGQGLGLSDASDG